jgi:hypothetical protein
LFNVQCSIINYKSQVTCQMLYTALRNKFLLASFEKFQNRHERKKRVKFSCLRMSEAHPSSKFY